MIKFPRHHIADSVAARIMAVARQTDPNSVQAQGARIDAALQQPVGDVAPMEGIEDAITLKALNV